MPRSRQPKAPPAADTEPATRSERETVVTLRLPRQLHQQLKDIGGERGLTREIRDRLQASFSEDPPGVSADPRFADLLSTLTYAASAAGRMYPAGKAVASRAVARHMFPGERIDEGGREVEDITAHWLLEACLMILLDAFRPAGLPSSLPNDVDEARAELLRRADRIVGAALSTLGERGADAFNRLSPMDQETIAASGPIGRRLAAVAVKRDDEGDGQ